MVIENPKQLEITINKRLKEIESEIDRLEDILTEKDKDWDFNRPITEYQEMCKPERKQISELYREQRLIIPYILTPIDNDNIGDLMTLTDFIDSCRDGLLINYDGFGLYVKDDMVSNVEIYPSDIKHNSIRNDFDHVLWFNR